MVTSFIALEPEDRVPLEEIDDFNFFNDMKVRVCFILLFLGDNRAISAGYLRHFITIGRRRCNTIQEVRGDDGNDDIRNSYLCSDDRFVRNFCNAYLCELGLVNPAWVLWQAQKLRRSGMALSSS